MLKFKLIAHIMKFGLMRKKMFLLDKRKTTNRFFGKQGGLSLIEMAIAIAVLGLLALPVLRAYRTNLMKASYENDLGALSTTLEGVNRYYISGHSSYPCPTDLSLKNGDTGFGVAGDCSDLNGIKLCTNTTWFEDDGICKTSTSSDATIIGGLPFADLKMSQENALDSWKNKLIYAVTHRQTDPTTYVNGNGSIQVMCVDDPKKIAAGTTGDNGAPDIVLSSGGSSIALYEIFVFSTGEDGIGGYNSSQKWYSSYFSKKTSDNPIRFPFSTKDLNPFNYFPNKLILFATIQFLTIILHYFRK